MTWFDMAANLSTTTGVTISQLLRDIPLTSLNSITVNGAMQYLQPVFYTGLNVTEQVHDPPRVETELQRLIRTAGAYGKHRKAPDPKKDWCRWNRRRMTGEHSLLKMLDVCDRLQWFDSKSVCLHYPNLGDYARRILLLHPDGRYEFSRTGRLVVKRNIWISHDESLWSWEDVVMTMIFHFQLSPKNFIYHTGCRDTVYADDNSYAKIRKDFEYGYELRIKAKERNQYQNLCKPFMENRKLPD